MVGAAVVVTAAAVVAHTCVVVGAGVPFRALVLLLGGATDGPEGWSPLWQVSQPDSVVSSK